MIRRPFFVLLLVALFTHSSAAQFRLDITRLADQADQVDQADDVGGEAVQLVGVRGFAMEPGVNAVRIWALGGDIRVENGYLNSLDAFEKGMLTEINLMAVEYQLSDQQRERLVLAGRRDMVRIQESMSIPGARKNNAAMNQMLQRVAAAQRMIKAGAFAENSMVAKVAGRILVGAHASADQRERVRYAYQSALQLVVAELDLVMPLSKPQRETFEVWIAKAAPPERMTPDVTYLTALEELRKTVGGLAVLSQPQRSQLDEMHKRISIGAIRPNGLIRSRRTVAHSLIKPRSK